MSSTEETTLSALDTCRSLEARLETVQQLLLNPKPEILERAVTELAEVIVVLRTLTSTQPQKSDSAMLASLHKIRTGARGLLAQIDQASNFCQGWIQMRLGTGYSNNGLPIFVQSEARSSFEG
jgi:hypothetical protein